MEMTDVQRALFQRAIESLLTDPDYAHPLPQIARLCGGEAMNDIKLRQKMYAGANAEVTNSGSALLSPEASLYWKEAQRVLAYSRLVLVRGSRSAEKALSLKCETLEESFASRVPDHEKGKFLVHDPESPDRWDDRWHSCIDGNFPLLRADLQKAPTIRNPLGRAQLEVLREMLDEADNYGHMIERQNLMERVAWARQPD